MPPYTKARWEEVTGLPFDETALNLCDRASRVLQKYNPNVEIGLSNSLKDAHFKEHLLRKFEGNMVSYALSLTAESKLERLIRYERGVEKLVTMRILLDTFDPDLKALWANRNPPKKHHVFSQSTSSSLDSAIAFFKGRIGKVERRGRKETPSLAWAAEIFVDLFEQIMGRRLKRNYYITHDEPPTFSNLDCVFIHELLKVLRPDISAGNVKSALSKLEPLRSEK